MATVCVVLAAIVPCTSVWCQPQDVSALAREAGDLSNEIITCLAGKAAVGCAETSVSRLRGLRARIESQAGKHPKLDSAVDAVVKSTQRRTLLEAAAQLQVLSETLSPGTVQPVPRQVGNGNPAAAPARGAVEAVETGIPSREVEKAGFSLTPVGLIETNNWLTQPPELNLNFVIKRADHTPFNGLTSERIAATVEGLPAGTGAAAKPQEFAVRVNASDLRTTNAASSSVILVIDASGSMVAGSRGESGQRLNKLSAAKSAIWDFLDKLRSDDKVAIIAFDEKPRILFDFSVSKTAAKAAIGSLEVYTSGSKYTALYAAMEMAVRKAKELSVRNVVFLTDGMEDTPRFRMLNADRKEPWKRQRERRIADLARESGGVRIYTIGIGDRGATGLAFVDCGTLDRISKMTNAGACNYIDLPDLARRARNSADEYHSSLVERLTGILAEISKAFHYDYTLVLRPDPRTLVRDGRPHIVRVLCNLDAVQLPVEFSYTWDTGSGAVEIDRPRSLAPIFIQTPDGGVGDLRLGRIYLSFLLALLALAAIPQLFRIAATQQELAVVRQSVLTIRRGSDLIGRECPNERNLLGSSELLKEGDAVIICPNPECRTPHHIGCWHSNRDSCRVRLSKDGSNCRTYLELSPAVLKAYGLDEKRRASA